jgi:hypothetical protein
MKTIAIRSVLFLAAATAFSGMAFAGEYRCQAPANPNRGNPGPFSIRVSAWAVGGEVELTAKDPSADPATAKDKTLSFGKVASVGVLNAADSGTRLAFEQALGMYGEPDVSGIKAEDLNKVTRIEAAAASMEVVIIRFFAGKSQLGGAFTEGGLGTACLATNP